MRKIYLLLGLLFLFCHQANACGNLSGTFYMSNNTMMILEQSGCSQIIRTNDTRAGDGSIAWQTPKTFKMDGTQVCDNSRHCEAVLAEKEIPIRFANNYGENIYVNGHGRCVQMYYFAQPDKYSNLDVKYLVKNCPDGYSGNFSKTYYKAQ
jgi:hypothetical protein